MKLKKTKMMIMMTGVMVMWLDDEKKPLDTVCGMQKVQKESIKSNRMRGLNRNTNVCMNVCVSVHRTIALVRARVMCVCERVCARAHCTNVMTEWLNK